MKQHLGLLVIVLALAMTRMATADPAGSEANPMVGIGPTGKWVKNDKWAMRATKVQTVATMEQLAALPWTARLTERKKKQLFRALETAFNEDGKLVLVSLEVKNLTGAKADIGMRYPYWTLRADDGQQTTRFTTIHDGKVVTASNDLILSDVAFCLEGGLPQSEKLNDRAKTGGLLPLLLPSYTAPSKLYMVSNHRYGKDESLVIDLTK